jgi:predicted nuclease of restriction endonuclease-like (RecB) superfamily
MLMDAADRTLHVDPPAHESFTVLADAKRDGSLSGQHRRLPTVNRGGNALRNRSGPGSLFRDVRKLILDAREQVARTTNATLTAAYWQVGDRIRRVVLNEKRADYGRKIVESLAARLAIEFGSGFGRANLFHMMRFAEAFPDSRIVYTLSRQLTWSHFCILIYQEKPLEREFYAAMCADQHWNVRELKRQIRSMLYERVALSKKPQGVVDKAIKVLRETGEMSPDMVLLDHVNLSALGLKDTLSSERQLEDAILREIELVLRELGSNFAFIKRQYRFRVDHETYSIDLLFFNRRLRALVAVDLKLGKFEPAHLGQMELYLRWLEQHEMLPSESRPYGIVLCATAAHEHLELLRLDEHGIHVAEYLTEFPARRLLEQRLHAAVERARNRLAANCPPTPRRARPKKKHPARRSRRSA